MTQAESIMELVPLIGQIEETGNFLKFRSNKPSYSATELDQAKEDINLIRRKLELMGVRDIPIHRAMTLEVNYRYAQDAQKRTLDALMQAKRRFDALNTLRNNGGMAPTPIEAAYFQAQAAKQAAMRMQAQKTK